MKYRFVRDNKVSYTHYQISEDREGIYLLEKFYESKRDLFGRKYGKCRKYVSKEQVLELSRKQRDRQDGFISYTDYFVNWIQRI